MTPPVEAPRVEPRKLLATRLVSLGAIPIAVFCAVYLLAARLLGLETTHTQGVTLTIALVGSVASLFLLGSFAARAVVGEVEAVREAVRNAVEGGPAPELPELTAPLEDLKHDVLGLAETLRSQ
ncbi:MAG TPA: hypothetical protein VFO24_06340, partial [Usitatibacter sp.]|nr:hypothetical protein [Usitatibacter sp.]